MDWDEAGAFLDDIRQFCRVVDLTAEMHNVGRALARATVCRSTMR